MLFRIFGADDAALHQPANVRMIASEAQDARAANQVQATVSDVGKIKLAAAENNGGAGGPHALEYRMALGKILNARVGRSQGLNQGGLRIVARGLIIDCANRFNRQAAGFLTALV